MTDIQRWRITGQPDPWMEPDDNGEVVDYADHVEALRQAEQRGLERGLASKTVKKRRILPSASASMATPLADKVNEYRRGYEQGQRDALARCVAAIESLPLYPYSGLAMKASAVDALRSIGDSND